MNQFKDYFLGIKTDLKRATSSQKCLRTGDLDEVGKTPFHHSFFEMLGNFSFGDYFKEEAITWAWEYLTQVLQLPRERLYISVHQDDQEAAEIWTKKIGVKNNLIARLGDKTNFWPANAPKDGPNGPCGPCSEIYFDQAGGQVSSADAWANDETRRFAEIWNLVFTQYDRQDGGKITPLQKKNIDTGMGLERLACVIQKKKTNFETDIFQPILEAMKKQHKNIDLSNIMKFYAIADHARAVVVAISDGAQPSNEGRGYVIRKLIRRAIWQGRTIGMNETILRPLVPVVVETLADTYPELRSAEKSVEQTVQAEETRFSETLDKGIQVLSRFLDEAVKRKNKILSGEEAFQLYDTYGFPDEMTRSISLERGIKIDEKKFETLLEEQRQRAKSASKIADSIFVTSEIEKQMAALPDTQFKGYETMKTFSKIIWEQISDGQGIVVLNETPFYPEGGGQVGDTGKIYSDQFEFEVVNTQKKGKVILHLGKLKHGSLKIDSTCSAEVNHERREAIKRNHTATHILQAALRETLGAHVRQVGSLVSDEKLRFDFTHGKALERKEIEKIEVWVNKVILENMSLDVSEKKYEDATKGGALAFFGEKYADRVRVVEIPGKSKELCGGTHCHWTGEIGAFSILNESSVGSGTRRIEALTGLNTVAFLNTLKDKLNQAAALVKSSPEELPERIEKMQARMKELEKGGGKSAKTAEIDVNEIIGKAKKVGKLSLISVTIKGEDVSQIRSLADQIRQKAVKSVIALFLNQQDKVSAIVTVSKDMSEGSNDIRPIGKDLASLLNGSFGGRKDWIQGGGKNVSGIESAEKALETAIKNLIGD